MDSFKKAKAAYRALKSGRNSAAREIFMRLSEEKGRYGLIGCIGLAVAEINDSCGEDKISEYLSKAVLQSDHAAELTKSERAYLKRLVNNSRFPEYRLPLIYFAGESRARELLLSLGADGDII